MFEEEILQLLNKNTVLTTEEIKDYLQIEKDAYADFNSAISRLDTQKEISEIGRDVYVRVKHTEWGDVIPTEGEITKAFYMRNNTGYFSGAAYYNAIGISTLVPCRREITTNRYKVTLDTIHHTDIIKPNVTITAENKPYLQLLDGIRDLSKNHCDTANPMNIFIEQLTCLKLSIVTLIQMAKKFYPEHVLNTVLHMEEFLNNDDVAFRQRCICVG